jgi:tetratricopeptide (TPR) repeat protein
VVLDRLETELDNLRAALEWALDADPETAVQIAAGLTYFWQLRGHFAEGRNWVITALARYEALTPPDGEPDRARLTLRAKAQLAAAIFAFALGELIAARSHATASTDLARAAKDPILLVYALIELGLSSLFLGDTATVDGVIDEAEESVRVTGDLWSRGFLISLQIERARRVRRDFAEAKALAEIGMQINRELGNPWAIGLNLFTLALAASQDGNHALARDRFEEAETVLRQLGDRHFVNAIRSERGHIERHLGHHAEALAYYMQALAGWQEEGALAATAHDLECVAFIACARSQPLVAARILGAAASLRASVDSPMTAIERVEYDQVLAYLGTELTPEGFAAAWNAGSILTKDEAITTAQDAARQMA